MIQFFISLFTQLVKRVANRRLTSMLQIALIHLACILSVIHSGYFGPVVEHMLLTLFTIWQIHRLEEIERELYITLWVLHLTFNTFTIFQMCYDAMHLTGVMDIPFILFRSFNIGMLIVHADMRLSADTLNSPQSEITVFNVISTLWPFLWPKTRQDQIKIIAQYAFRYLSTLFYALCITEEQKKYIDGSLSLNPVISSLTFRSLNEVFDNLYHHFSTEVNLHCSNYLEMQVFSHILHLSADFHFKKDSSVISIALSDGDRILQFCRETAAEAMPIIMDLILGVRFLLRIFGPKGASIIFVANIFYLILNIAISSSDEEVQLSDESERNVSSTQRDSINGWPNLAQFNLITYTEHKVEQLIGKASETSLRLSRRFYIRSTYTELYLLTVLGLIEIALVYGIHKNEANISDLVLFLTYWYKITGSIGYFVSIRNRARQHLVTARHLVSILRTQPTVKDSPEAKPLEFCKGRIEFKNVYFGYDTGKSLLRNFNLLIEAGESVAIVGPSGGGKSTTASLVLRLFNLTKGIIYIDGCDICDFTIQSVREHINAVPQSILIHDGDIMHNVICGNMSATDEEVVNACKAADLDKDIQAFERGYQTLLGEKGQKLSGGQTQRIAIARAILQGPAMPILVWDEPTSALDNITAKKVIEYFIEQKATKIIITHKLEIASTMPRIVMIKDGEIVADGSHSKLIQISDEYRALWQAQSTPSELKKAQRRNSM